MNETTKRMALIIGMITSIVWSFNMKACAISEQEKGANYWRGLNDGRKLEGAK